MENESTSKNQRTIEVAIPSFRAFGQLLYQAIKRDQKSMDKSSNTLDIIECIFSRIEVIATAFDFENSEGDLYCEIDKVLLGWIYCSIYSEGFEHAVEKLKKATLKAIGLMISRRFESKNKDIAKVLLVLLMNPSITQLHDSNNEEVFPQLCRIICLLSEQQQRYLMRMMASTPNKWWEEPDSHRILASEVLKLKVFKSVISKHIDKLNKMKNGEPSSVGKRGIGEIQSAEESSESDKRKKTKVCTGREKEGNKLSFDGVNFKGELLECVSSDGPSLDDVETEKDGNTELTIIHTNSEPEQPETEKKISKEMLERVNKSFFNSKEGDYSSRKKRGSHFGYFVNTFQQFITTYVVKLANAAGLRANQLANETKSTKQIICAALKTPALLQTIQCFNLLYKYNKKWSLVPIQLFYNEKINEYIEIKDDFPQYKMMDGFSFCNFPFLLSPLTKSEVIKLENTMQMRTELQDSFFHAMFVGVTCPYLLLEVRRDWLVRDTMCQLQLKSGIDLKKQLKVRFVGEEGVDEGGVQKEFFQLLVREMFDEKYGMFSYNYDTNNSWFASSMAHDSPYLHEMRLIGMVLGLSVYNSVILNIHFPSVLYKKLLGIPSNFSDLASFDPDLYNSFYKILFNSTPEEIDAIERYFEVSYTNLDQPDIYELVPNGSQIKLTYENRREFVELYLDFLFHKSCKEQFESFQKGFFSICQNSYVMTLRAEELELLVCGSSELDFEVLDKTTVYDGGYTRETNVVKNFWDIVKGFSVELKKKLLFFTTGSDRVPIGGMCKLRFVIVKNGVDSDRLPTSHTCFNALLLPEYKTYQKLEERLTTAINNSEGFGMM